jgi:hypothetical protein
MDIPILIISEYLVADRTPMALLLPNQSQFSSLHFTFFPALNLPLFEVQLVNRIIWISLRPDFNVTSYRDIFAGEQPLQAVIRIDTLEYPVFATYRVKILLFHPVLVAITVPTA